MDDFFENIYVYLPILVLVLIRLLRSAGKRKPERRPPPAAVTESAFDFEEEAPAFPKSPPPRGVPAPGALPSGGTPRSAPSVRDLPDAGGRPAPKRGARVPAAGALPALQQAAVWAELLGPPKGLQDG
jgi:hypothetical protein